MKFSPGQTVGIPCKIERGAFSNEYLVTIDTERGILSGFAHQQDVRVEPTNPSSSDFQTIRVMDPVPFEFDLRLLKP